MSDDQMLKCLIAFILGWLASRMMGNGFSVGAWNSEEECKKSIPSTNLSGGGASTETATEACGMKSVICVDQRNEGFWTTICPPI